METDLTLEMQSEEKEEKEESSLDWKVLEIWHREEEQVGKGDSAEDARWSSSSIEYTIVRLFACISFSEGQNVSY